MTFNQALKVQIYLRAFYCKIVNFNNESRKLISRFVTMCFETNREMRFVIKYLRFKVVSNHVGHLSSVEGKYNMLTNILWDDYCRCVN